MHTLTDFEETIQKPPVIRHKYDRAVVCRVRVAARYL